MSLCQGFQAIGVFVSNSSAHFISCFSLSALVLVAQHFLLLLLNWDVFLLPQFFAPGFTPVHAQMLKA